MKTLNIIIAIDGHSSTGKSTFAKMIAEKYSLIYIDTGALYRGITLYAVENNMITEDKISEDRLKEALSLIKMEFIQTEESPHGELFIDGVQAEPKIRSMRISSIVSIIATIPFVREFVDAILKRYGKERGVVMDGRDIGTAVFPDAEIKIFMTADPEVRAKRRYDEMVKKGENPDYAHVLRNVMERDRLDEEREIAPLKKAKDAIILDNSNISLEKQMSWIDSIIKKYTKAKHISLDVSIDNNSGFCYGVVRAIESAENYLEKHDKLYSLGSIVHNNSEIKRLQLKGLEIIDYARLREMKEGTILIRAHGEPPLSYKIASENNLRIIDCTCPVVLKLQEKIKNNHDQLKKINGQLVIFGKYGHAEVNGLIGQVDGDAIIIEDTKDLNRIDFSRAINIFSQTTKDPLEYTTICNTIRRKINEVGGPICEFKEFNTICGQVSSRHPNLNEFAKSHSLIIFVSGKESSNGKILYKLCRSQNPRSYTIESKTEINKAWFIDGDSVGICGATSTPKWLLEEMAKYITELFS